MTASIKEIKKREHGLLSYDRAAELLTYDAISGNLFWRKSKGPGRKGAVAGCKSGKYVRIRIDQHDFVAHRLAWLLHHGEWPDGLIDHKDHDGKNNAIDNLRVATCKDNLGNSRRHIDSASGFKGACWDKRKMAWCAHIYADGRLKFLGYHSSAEQAHRAYMVAAKKVFGEFAFSGGV